MEGKLDIVLAAIEKSRVSMESKISSLAHDFNIMLEEHRKLKDRVKNTENLLAELKPMTPANEGTLQDLRERVRFLEGRAEDTEGRSQRSNIRVVRVPEGAEGRDAVTFLENWIQSFTPAESRTPLFSLERAHRVPTRRPLVGAPPRPMVMKLLHFRD